MTLIVHRTKSSLSKQPQKFRFFRSSLCTTFGWFEKRRADGTPLPKTVRTLLGNDFPSILPKTPMANAQIMDKLLSGPGEQPNIAAVIRKCVVRTNAIAFFGEELGRLSFCCCRSTTITIGTLLSQREEVYECRG